MLVADLIEKLQQCERDKEVYFVDDEHGLTEVNIVRTSGEAVVLDT